MTDSLSFLELCILTISPHVSRAKIVLTLLFHISEFGGSKRAQGPNGLYVPKHENWCDTRLCAQLNLYGDGSSSCKENLCHFIVPYGKEENIEGVVIRDDAILSNSSVPVNDKNYRRLNLVFG